jgi:hypothetical protein
MRTVRELIGPRAAPDALAVGVRAAGCHAVRSASDGESRAALTAGQMLAVAPTVIATPKRSEHLEPTQRCSAQRRRGDAAESPGR